jgi:8-oxo-(d)GTP phosphatase
VLREFATATADALVLLVRHASAGDRYAWRGPDDERPLDGTGERQVARLTGILALFAPDRVLSADPVRCVRTVEPLAERLGLDLEVDHAFSEDGYADDPARAIRRIRSLARTAANGAEIDAGGRTPVSVISGQGGGIPDMVATLATEDGVDLPHFRSRKGSVWALSFRAGLLLYADYYRDFDPPPLD